MHTLPEKQLNFFKKMIDDYYQSNRREFPWRNSPTPYQVVVSEIMLQQTQTYRVIEKYIRFITELPDFAALAAAPTRQVLALWQGLGYNRRGLALQLIAQQIMTEHNGKLPNTPQVLERFKGIGPATAASITAFAFNAPTVFIETNIRAVFIHHFFHHRTDVHDKEIMPLVAATVDQKKPREWYYALMDYGVMLKKSYKNPCHKSAHHAKQSRFEGSERQIRGLILKFLTRYPALTYDQILEAVGKEPVRIDRNLAELAKEGLIKEKDGIYCI
jgi:A/G-specific adenine glycosylase